MKTIAIFTLNVVFRIVCTGQPIEIDITSDGRYSLNVGSQPWLNSGATYMTLQGKKYITSDGSLQLLKNTQIEGCDKLGCGKLTSLVYQCAGTQTQMITEIQAYDLKPYVILNQYFNQEVAGTNTGNDQSVCTAFPSFLTETPTNQQLGFLAYGGIFVGDTHKTTGIFNNETAAISSGLDSGPLILFSSTNSSTVVISPFSNFMAASTVYENGSVSWGLLGTASNIPAGFSYKTIIYHSPDGINAAISGWGDVMRNYYEKPSSFKDSDLSINYLGYWTDNGAYYYYLTEKGKNYENTLLDVQTYFQKAGIPYRYIQYDSWFYPQGPFKGVLEWTSMSQIFPDGLKSLWNKTGLPAVAHNRWWSDKTVYATQNGGKYGFIVETDTHKALPIDEKFWDDLMATSKEWGLIVYEQDWLNIQFNAMDATKSDLNLGTQWLRQMGNAAAKAGLTIQYCMSPSRAALESLEIPTVTQARVSDDYQPGGEQWRIGVSSIMAEALGLAPFKDNFWSTVEQPGNIYNRKEDHPALNALVSTLSTGPVAIGDMIGKSNVSLIMKSCNAEGLLLKPTRPARAIDEQIRTSAFDGRLNQGKAIGEVWTTYSDINTYRFGIIFSADLKRDYMIGPMEAGFGYSVDGAVFSYNPTTPIAMDFDLTSSLKLTNCTKDNICLYYTTPIFERGSIADLFLIFGELDKWVPMSPQRVTNIIITSTEVALDLKGAIGEEVTFHFTFRSQWIHQTCTISNSGKVRMIIAETSKMCLNI